jgi:hypothetical protein
MAGLTTIFGGDDRFYNNILIGDVNNKEKYSLEGYNDTKLPVWIKGNLYYNDAKPSSKDENFSVSLKNPLLKLVENKGETFLEFTFDEAFFNHKAEMINTDVLGKAKIPKASFENPDGTPLVIDTDYFGNKRDAANILSGPFVNVKSGKVVLKVW